jgi:hypothetical protein
MCRSPVLLCLTCAVMLLIAGCTQTSFGTRTPVGFGTSAEDQQITDCLKAKYGEPCKDGPPRFVEPILATQLNERNLPVNSVVKLNRNAKSVYFWVFFDRFQPKDPVTLSMKYLPTDRVVDSVEKTPEGNCGAIHAEYLMPDGGWPAGKYEITISGRGVTAAKAFEVITGDTVTAPLPYSAEQCTGTSGGITMATTAPAGFGTAATAASGQVAPAAQAQNTGQQQAGYAAASFTGCWVLNSSRCGQTQLQLEDDIIIDGQPVAGGYICDRSTSVRGTTNDSTLVGTWAYYQIPAGTGGSCCRFQLGRYYCDPVCQARQAAENLWGGFGGESGVETGRIELVMNRADRSLEGRWGTGSGAPAIPVHGSLSTMCNVNFAVAQEPFDSTGCWQSSQGRRIFIERQQGTIAGVERYVGHSGGTPPILDLWNGTIRPDRNMEMDGRCRGYPCIPDIDQEIQEYGQNNFILIISPAPDASSGQAEFTWITMEHLQLYHEDPDWFYWYHRGRSTETMSRC